MVKLRRGLASYAKHGVEEQLASLPDQFAGWVVLFGWLAMSGKPPFEFHSFL